MPWEDTFTEGLDALAQDLENAAPIAVTRGAEGIRAFSAPRVPRDTGHLEGSAEVRLLGAGWSATATCRYPGPYARRQEFELHWKHPRKGQALYLTTTVRVDAPRILDLVAAAFQAVI